MGATASEKAQPHHAPGSLPCQPRRCLLWQEGGRPPGPCWCRPCCPPLPQLRQQGHRGVLPSTFFFFFFFFVFCVVLCCVLLCFVLCCVLCCVLCFLFILS